MKVLLLVCLVSAVAAIDVATRNSQLADTDSNGESEAANALQKKWDIWGFKLFTGKDRRHEGFANEAFALLSKNDAKVKDYLVAEKLVHGIMWNDMPVEEDTYNTYLNGADWFIDFKAKKAPGIVHASHFGCAMHWHGMQSEFDPRTIKGSAIKEVFFTNANVKKQIYQIAQYWWDRAVGEGKGTGGQAANPERASFTIGHILHLVTDSQAEGHILRGWSKTATLDKEFKFDDQASVVQCPPVVYYMGYIAEDGNDEHGKSDHDPFPLDSTKDPRNKAHRILAHCARAYAFRVIRAYYRCMKGESCDFTAALKPILDHEFAWADKSLASKIAAGASDVFIGAKAKGSGKFAIDTAIEYVDLEGKPQKNVWTPTDAATKKDGVRVWDAMAQDKEADIRNAGLCTSLTARYGITRKWTRDFTTYVNPTPVTTGGEDTDPTVRTSMTMQIGETTATGNPTLKAKTKK